MLTSLRRWLHRHPARWVLGALLGLALSGAQLLAAGHEISHAFAFGGPGPAGASTGAANGPASPIGDPGVSRDHGCALCLLAAALGGVAAAPPGPVLPAVHGLAAAPRAAAHAFTPRLVRAYASRAPPAAPAIA